MKNIGKKIGDISSFFPDQTILRIFSKEGDVKIEIITSPDKIEKDKISDKDLLEMSLIIYTGEIVKKADDSVIMVSEIKTERLDLSDTIKKKYLKNFEEFFSKLLEFIYEEFSKEN